MVSTRVLSNHPYHTHPYLIVFSTMLNKCHEIKGSINDIYYYKVGLFTPILQMKKLSPRESKCGQDPPSDK